MNRPRPRATSMALTFTGTVALFVLSGASTFASDEITLVGGNVINAQIVEEHDDRIVVEHAALGRLEIARDRIVADAPPVDAPSIKTEIALGMLARQDDAAPPAEAAPPQWESSFTFGASGAWGNTDSQNLNTNLSSTLDQGDEVTKIDLNYFLAVSNGDRTDNRFNANLLHDWLMPDSPWLYFMQSRYDYDRFQDWEHRLSGHLGFGYRLVDDEVHRLSLRGGAGVSKEWKSEENELRPEILFGVDWDWTISEKQSFHVDSTIFPDLENSGEFRTLTNANWSVLLDEETSMSLTAGVFHEYQSDVSSDVDKNDVKVFIGLKFEF